MTNFLTPFLASNGKLIEYATPIYLITVVGKDGKKEMTTTLMHPHFHQDVFRNAFGHYDRETRKALNEFVDSLGITEVKNGRRDGRQNEITVTKNIEE